MVEEQKNYVFHGPQSRQGRANGLFSKGKGRHRIVLSHFFHVRNPRRERRLPQLPFLVEDKTSAIPAHTSTPAKTRTLVAGIRPRAPPPERTSRFRKAEWAWTAAPCSRRTAKRLFHYDFHVFSGRNGSPLRS